MSFDLSDATQILESKMTGLDDRLERIANALEAMVPKYRKCGDCGAWREYNSGLAGVCGRHAKMPIPVESFTPDWPEAKPSEGCAESIPKEASDE